MIQTIITRTNRILAEMRENKELTKRALAVGTEINQRYTEYLDDLLDCDLSCTLDVTVDIDGNRIHFPDSDSLAAWLAENME